MDIMAYLRCAGALGGIVLILLLSSHIKAWARRKGEEPHV